MPITTTLNRIRAHSPCKGGWEQLLRHLGKTQADDEPLPFSVILDSNGLDDALWCCRAEPQHASVWRHFAVDCAESIKHLTTDERSLKALEVARRHADGLATDGELQAAWAAADAAADAATWDVWAVWAAADAAAWAAWTAVGAATWAAAAWTANTFPDNFRKHIA